MHFLESEGKCWDPQTKKEHNKKKNEESLTLTSWEWEWLTQTVFFVGGGYIPYILYQSNPMKTGKTSEQIFNGFLCSKIINWVEIQK